ncbi:MAG: hypothetical protein ACRC92_27010 [Peptostreptococcaceae bacterium]
MNEVLDYLGKEDIQFLIRKMRLSPYSRDMYYLWMDNNTLIHDTHVYCYINGMLSRVLDSYNILERRKDFIFYGSYKKGEPRKYMTKCASILMSMKFDHKEILIYHILSSIKEIFYNVPIIVNGRIGIDHSYEDYLDTYLENEEFKNLVDRPIINNKMNPYEIADKLNDMANSFVTRISIKPLTELLKAGVKINNQNIIQNFAWGLVPDKLDTTKMEEYLIPEGCFTGYINKFTYYVDGNIGRKAMVSMKQDVKRVGHFSKMLSVALLMVKLNKTGTREHIHDCGSTRYDTITIHTESDLKYNRFTHFLNEKTGKLEVITDDRIDLIGRTIKIRTAYYCDGDTICETCWGANASFCRDTELYKVNIGVNTLEEASDKMQGVISLKHTITGRLMKIFLSKIINGKPDEPKFILDYIKENKNIKEMQYNQLIINKACNVGITVDNITGEKYLRIDAEKIKFQNSSPISIENRNDCIAVKITLPNESVLTKASDMLTALNKHNQTPEFKNNKTLSEMTVDQQLRFVYDFIESKIEFPHRKYVEMLVYAMVRDIDSPYKRVSKDSRGILFIKTDEAIKKPAYSNSITKTLPHGFVADKLKYIPMLEDGYQPEEYDILYINRSKEKDKSVYTIFNDLITSSLINNTHPQSV